MWSQFTSTSSSTSQHNCTCCDNKKVKITLTTADYCTWQSQNKVMKHNPSAVQTTMSDMMLQRCVTLSHMGSQCFTLWEIVSYTTAHVPASYAVKITVKLHSKSGLYWNTVSILITTDHCTWHSHSEVMKHNLSAVMTTMSHIMLQHFVTLSHIWSQCITLCDILWQCDCTCSYSYEVEITLITADHCTWYSHNQVIMRYTSEV